MCALSTCLLPGCGSQGTPEQGTRNDRPFEMDLDGPPARSKVDVLAILGIPDEVVDGPDRKVAWSYSRGDESQEMLYAHMVFIWNEDGRMVHFWYGNNDLSDDLKVWAWSERESNVDDQEGTGWGDPANW